MKFNRTSQLYYPYSCSHGASNFAKAKAHKRILDYLSPITDIVFIRRIVGFQVSNELLQARNKKKTAQLFARYSPRKGCTSIISAKYIRMYAHADLRETVSKSRCILQRTAVIFSFGAVVQSRTFSVFLEKLPPRNVRNIPRGEGLVFAYFAGRGA